MKRNEVRQRESGGGGRGTGVRKVSGRIGEAVGVRGEGGGDKVFVTLSSE